MNCPHCGKEILATAKKCKYCGEWIEKKCPYCGEWIQADAMKCKHCGSWLDKSAKEKYEQENSIQQPSVAPVAAGNVEVTDNKIDIKEAIEEHEDNHRAGWVVVLEIGIIGVLFGQMYDWRWWQYILAYGIALILLSFRILRIIYCIGMSLLWGFVAVALSPWIFNETDWEELSRLINQDYGDYWWFGLLVCVISLVFHWPAMKSNFSMSD